MGVHVYIYVFVLYIYMVHLSLKQKSQTTDMHTPAQYSYPSPHNYLMIPGCIKIGGLDICK